jgi:staphylococcal nuclease domain-containing protein 1
LSTNVGNKDDKVKPYAEESLNFSIKKLSNKDVEVVIDRCDKNGNFLGNIFLGEENYSESILQEGLAFISHGIANRFKNYNELVKAENVAKNAKKNIFSLPDDKIYASDSNAKKFERQKESKDVEPSKSSDLFSIRITEFADATHFYLQTPEAGEQLEKIETIMSKLKLEEGKNKNLKISFSIYSKSW